MQHRFLFLVFITIVSALSLYTADGRAETGGDGAYVRRRPPEVLPKTVSPRRHLSVKLIAADDAWLTWDGQISYVSPGMTVSIDWHLLRFFSLGLSGSSFVMLDAFKGQTPVLCHNRLEFIPRFSLPANAGFFVSIGLAMGNDLGLMVEDISVGGGFSGAAVVGLKGFFGKWGIAIDLRSGFDYLWGAHGNIDALLTIIQAELGAVYRF